MEAKKKLEMEMDMMGAGGGGNVPLEQWVFKHIESLEYDLIVL